MKMLSYNENQLEMIMKENIQKIERWSLEFMTDTYDHVLREISDYLVFLEENYGCCNNLLLMQFLVEFISNIKMILRKEYQASLSDFLTDHELMDLFGRSIRSGTDMKNWLQNFSAHLAPYRKRRESSSAFAVEDVKRYIKDNLRNNFTRKELADLVHIHPDHLSHVFRNQTGISIREYVTNKRISYAKFLLCHTNLYISKVALECGYENAAYFSKIFRKSTGMTPKEFKKSASGELSANIESALTGEIKEDKF